MYKLVCAIYFSLLHNGIKMQTIKQNQLNKTKKKEQHSKTPPPTTTPTTKCMHTKILESEKLRKISVFALNIESDHL